ncbi:hypothetical protein [Brevundimonas sp. UBA5866]|uniref:hypothetical protein n=1 Tax=Brevundimonas sp. UBA5866 TaxID=1946132 RepID=UPI0025BF2103|nr:hypothetical protein [Brevundimonas sp. UBA5866]
MWCSALLGAVLAFGADPVRAGAWNQSKGQGQLIVKYEPVWSIHRFDADGDRFMQEHERVDHVVSLWAEYGLSERVTLLLKTDWQDADDGVRSYRGIGPTEIGARWQFLSVGQTVASVQSTYVSDSQGRNAAWGSPGEGAQELDIRLLAGHTFTKGRRAKFVEVQLARRWRESLSDDTRVEATAGVHLSNDYTLLSQIYAGQGDEEAGDKGARWLTAEIGAVRHWDAWSAQLGWRATVAGRKVNAGDGPIVALWRRF